MMIQVYKKNGLFIIEDTIVDIVYPNLTKEETIKILKQFGRNEDRVNHPITDINHKTFEYSSLDDKDKQITDLQAKLDKTQSAHTDLTNKWLKSIKDWETIIKKEHQKVKELEEQKDLLVKSITKYNSSVSLETDNVKIETDEQRYNILVHLINELGKVRYDNDQLKQQLRELPKKILKDIQENFDCKHCCEIRKYYDQQYIWLNHVAFYEFLDNIFKKYEEKNND